MLIARLYYLKALGVFAVYCMYSTRGYLPRLLQIHRLLNINIGDCFGTAHSTPYNYFQMKWNLPSGRHRRPEFPRGGIHSQEMIGDEVVKIKKSSISCQIFHINEQLLQWRKSEAGSAFLLQTQKALLT
jgi:hypothetical protein